MNWVIWAIISLVMLIAEALSVDFLFMMLFFGTLGATITAVIAPDALAVQIVVFAVVSLLGIAFVRPWARRHVNEKRTPESNVYALVGKQAQALSAISATSGRVKISGEVWSAKSQVGEIPEGASVVIEAVEGARVIVAPLPTQS